jgi:hypothetical protein
MKGGCYGIVGMALLIVLCFSNASAFAESLSDDELTRRIDFIQERLDAGRINAKQWQYSWMFINGCSSYIQFGLATTQTDEEDEHDRYDNIVGGATSLLAVGDLTVNPLVAWNAGEKLKALPETTGDEKKAKLKHAEQFLKKSADREEYGRSWKTHALSGLVSLIGGVVIACDDDRADDGAFFFATSMAVAEIQIFTMPTRSINDWKEYSAMSSEDFKAEVQNSPLNRFFISANPQGLFCTILF